MHDTKVIKKIFNLAWYDFNNNLTNWLSITGLHAIILILIFFGLSIFADIFDMTSWASIPNFFTDWMVLFDTFLNFYEFYNFRIVGMVIAWSLVGMYLFFPLIIIQNCLDLAFDSAMRGMSVSGPIVSYCAVVVLCHVIFFGLYQLINYGIIFLLYHVLQHNFVVHIFMIKFFMMVMSLIFLYSMQCMYILTMHTIEYRKTIWLSVQETWAMLEGKNLLLLKVLLLQILCAGLSLALIYFCFENVIEIIIPFMTWIFTVLSLDIPIILILILYNFFYAWVYIVLFSWICLVIAHLYRQLICPPIDNISCAACTDCEK